MREHTDHRIVDRPEPIERLVRLFQEALDAVRRAAQLLQRLLELDGGRFDIRQR
jgi:hypothetical protein